MSFSANAEESDANQSKFYRVISSKPVTNADALFDTLSKFLTKDKKRQIAMDFLDEKDLLSSRLTWNNLRNVANCVIEEGCSQDRSPIPAWVEQKDPIVVDEETATPIEITGNPDSANDEPDPVPQQEKDAIKVEPGPPTQGDTMEDAKEAKKAAKEARKRERAEKRKAKEARREEREAKRAKKEAKKKRKEE